MKTFRTNLFCQPQPGIAVAKTKDNMFDFHFEQAIQLVFAANYFCPAEFTPVAVYIDIVEESKDSILF